MSQRGVEQLLGRVISDPEFRRRFYEDAVATCDAAGLQLTQREVEAVQATDEMAVRAFAAHLDPRIVRAPLGPGRGIVVTARLRRRTTPRGKHA
jgi:single-stranded DNA-binding protein